MPDGEPYEAFPLKPVKKEQEEKKVNKNNFTDGRSH